MATAPATATKSAALNHSQARELMPKIALFVYHSVAMLAALTGLTVLVAPTERVLAGGSAPVTVVNPSNSPVPTSSVDDPGRVAYQSFVVGGSGCIGQASCGYQFPNVPPGHRLVIQHVSGFLGINGDPGSVVVTVAGSGAPSTGFLAPFAPYRGYVSQFDQPVLLYLDAGETPVVELNLGSSTLIGPGGMQLAGYLLDCTVSPCAEIAPSLQPR